MNLNMTQSDIRPKPCEMTDIKHPKSTAELTWSWTMCRSNYELVTRWFNQLLKHHCCHYFSTIIMYVLIDVFNKDIVKPLVKISSCFMSYAEYQEVANSGVTFALLHQY